MVPSLLPARRRIWIAVALSVVIHALIFSLPGRKRPQETMGGAPPPFQVTLDLAPTPTEEAAPPASAPPQAPRVVTPPTRPRVLASREPAKKPAPPLPVEEPPPVPPPPPRPPPPQADMGAMIAARRAQRLAAEAAAARGPQQGPEPTPADSALASIDRNLQTLGPGEGVGGVFQILRKGSLSGEFSFDGWLPDRGRRWREVIEVRAGPDGDIEKAMVRRMIELIRTHYSGDFNFQSRRVGRIVVLSARPEDQAELERFLTNELFGVPILNRTK